MDSRWKEGGRRVTLLPGSSQLIALSILSAFVSPALPPLIPFIFLSLWSPCPSSLLQGRLFSPSSFFFPEEDANSKRLNSSLMINTFSRLSHTNTHTVHSAECAEEVKKKLLVWLWHRFHLRYKHKFFIPVFFSFHTVASCFEVEPYSSNTKVSVVKLIRFSRLWLLIYWAIPCLILHYINFNYIIHYNYIIAFLAISKFLA